MITVYSLWDIFMQLRTDCAPDYNLGCIVSEGIEALDPLLREYFINEIRERVGITFDATGILSARLYEIGGLLDTCDPEDYVCIANLEIPEIEAALKTTLVALINAITGMAADGTEFDERGISVLRLAQIQVLIEPYMVNDLEDLVSLIGAVPEIEEVIRQRWLEAKFEAIQVALHQAPEANIVSLVASYQAAIEDAYDFTFEVETGAQIWQFISIHFVGQGMYATACAIRQWVGSKIISQQEDMRMNRFNLFRRAFGNFTIMNVSEINDSAVAERRPGGIVVFTQTDGDQWYMTPNNLIHELGHMFDDKAGFGTKRLGSLAGTIRLEVENEQLDYTRAGMAEGRDYLRQRSLEHSHISDAGNSIPEYTPLPNKQPTSSDAEYEQFVPERYLFYDVADSKYNVWRSSVYSHRYGENARIDTLVINETEDEFETAADAFLNWVRNSFGDKEGENRAAMWGNDFFGVNIGMFLRNAVIYNLGMKNHFGEPHKFPASPQRNIVPGTFQVRLAPIVDPSTNLGKAFDPDNPEDDIDLTVTRTYGWAENEGFTWFLIEDNSNRLVWIVEDGVEFVIEDKATDRKIDDPLWLSPGRAYTAIDLFTITGEGY